MVLEDARMMLRFLIMMRCQRYGKDGNACFQPGLHQALDHGLRHEFMAIDATVDDERGRRHRRVLSGTRKVAGKQGKFERARHGEDIHLRIGNDLLKTGKSLVDDIRMPSGFDEGVSGLRQCDPLS